MPESATTIQKLAWVEDGIDKSEFVAGMGLIRLAGTEYLPRLVEEPWVVEGSNYPALESLWYLVANNSRKLRQIMSHPTINDGISNQEAKIIATLHGVDSELVDKLLDPEQVTLEEQTITLPLAGETELTIIRTGPGRRSSIKFLEDSVRKIEEFMEFPLPRRQVIYLIDDTLKVRGRNYSTHVSIRSEIASDFEESTLKLIAHEAGHYYWEGFALWINEGASHIMASVADDTIQGPLISLTCPQSRSIAEFEEWERKSAMYGKVHECHYSFGERLFRDLYYNVGDTAFRLAFRDLYLQGAFDIAEDECDDSDEAAICRVKAVFTTNAPEEKATTIETVISRWYDLPKTYDLSHIQGTPANPYIAAVNGQIEEAYLSLDLEGSPVSVVYVGPHRNPLIYLNLEYSYRITRDLPYLPLYVDLYLDDGSGIQRMLTDLEMMPAHYPVMRWKHFIDVGFWRETGRFWVQVYSGEQKIVEETFEAVPEPDPRRIRGVVTDSEGQPLEGIALKAILGEEEFWVRAEPDGTFDIVASTGSFILEVNLLDDNYWHFVGWYDGNSGVITDPNKAFEIVVDYEDVEGIEIILRADPQALLCPSGQYRSTETGQCG